MANFAYNGSDLSSVSNTGNFGFAGDALAAGVNLSNLRFNDPTATQKHLHVEPEFMAFAGDKVVVSLQENNGLGVFDPATKKWTALHGLGTITQTVDASDKDGIDISDVIAGIPEPDTIVSYSQNGQHFIVTANEGDARVDDGDVIGIEDMVLDPATAQHLTDIYGDYTDNNALGRMDFSAVDGDTDGDGDIDVPTMFGTRSFSIWNPETGELIADSGSLESFLLEVDPTRHNANDGGDTGEFDKRSDNKGPEPEGLDVIVLEDGTVYLAIGMERQNGIVLADITDPNDIQLIDHLNDADNGLKSPESFKFVDGLNSPTGTPLLIVGYEGVDGAGNGLGFYELTVPEPASAALLGLGSLFITARRRRK